ncbi:MAG: hypothetical protein WCW25_03310 [Patescibacteria group bacterium]|jgi:hypothetical protein
MDNIQQEIFELVLKKMREQGAYDRDAFREFISETISYFQEKGKITDDDDYEQMEDELLERWTDAEDLLVK